MHERARVAWSTGLALLLMTGLLAACGGDDDETASSGSGGDGGGESASGCAQEAKDLVAQNKEPMKPVLPEAAFDMAKNKGKNIWYISPSQATGYALALSKSVTAASEAAGMTTTIFDGKNQPDRFTQGFQQAVQSGADGIVLYAINPELVPEGLKAAQEADVPVITMATGVPAPPDSSVVTAIDHDRVAEGEYMANYAASITDCEVNAAITLDPAYVGLVTERDAIADQLEKLCPDSCEVQDLEMQLGTMATELAPNTQSFIQRNQDLNTIFATFDQAATYQIPAVEQAGTDTKIVGTNGLEENLKAVKDGSPQVADVAYVPPDYFGWLGVDQLGRAMAGEKVGDASGEDLKTPVQTFDAENLPDDVTDLDAVFSGLVGYQDQFREKWGM
jgi:ABC-type sugar transport system substrate-binding protein